MYDLPPRRLVSLILVKLGPAHLVSCSCQRSQSSPAPGRAHGHSYFITGSTNFTANSFICNQFTAVGYTDKARALQQSALPSTGGARLSRARRLFSLVSHIIQLTPQELSAEQRNSASAEALAVVIRPKEASREKTRPPPFFCFPPLGSSAV